MDIVHWLRHEIRIIFLQGEPNRLLEAADKIERMQEWNDNAQEKIGLLEIEIERLRTALEKIASNKKCANSMLMDYHCERSLIAKMTLEQNWHWDKPIQQKDSE